MNASGRFSYVAYGKILCVGGTCKRMKLSDQDEKLFREILTEVCRHSRLLQSDKFIQHGITSVFRHSVAVAYVSFCIAHKYRIKIDEYALIRGALLHDYFLYDWHEKDASHKWHGFYHAGKALKNAMEDFELNAVEQNTIERHMFPLNPIPPCCREAWIVCLADKICSGSETADGLRRYFVVKWNCKE